MASRNLMLLAISLGAVFGMGSASTALAGRLEVENYDLPPDGGFTNPFFNHELGPYEFDPVAAADEGFINADFISSPFSYFLSAGTDFITFSLAEGEFVDHAQIWLASTVPWGPSTFHAIGRDAANNRLDLIIDSPPTPSSDNLWFLVDTSSLPFDQITEIRLSGIAKGFFDDLTVTVVPEPATWLMLGIGIGYLVWTRKRRTAIR